MRLLKELEEEICTRFTALGSKPVMSGCQAFLLNRIEMGQFINMKYKAGKAKIKPQVVVKLKPLIPLFGINI